MQDKKRVVRDVRSGRGDGLREGEMRDARGGVGAVTREPRLEMRDRILR